MTNLTEIDTLSGKHISVTTKHDGQDRIIAGWCTAIEQPTFGRFLDENGTEKRVLGRWVCFNYGHAVFVTEDSSIHEMEPPPVPIQV